jgi:hypothetical protein
VTLVLDAGALAAYDRGNRTVQAFLKRAYATSTTVRTTTGVVAQVWRDGSRQARLAQLLRGVAEEQFDGGHARRVGVLLGAAGRSDVIDASIVDAAVDGDEILTSDPDDIAALAMASGKTLIITTV